KWVGVDTPYVDAINSKELAGPHALHKQDIYILETVTLDGIEEGGYELVALPLALEEADGSSVRAVIRPIKEGEALRIPMSIRRLKVNKTSIQISKKVWHMVITWGLILYYPVSIR